MITLLIYLLVAALVIMLAAWLLPGISVKNFGWAFLAAVIVGLLNACIAYLLEKLGLDATYGAIVSLLVNALSIWLAGKLLSGFTVKNFVWALVCALVIAVCQWLLGPLF